VTTAAETGIREIKTAIASLTIGIEANTKAIESISRLTEANVKAIADLTLDMRVGFANVDTKFAKLEGKIDTVEAKLEGKIDKLEERTNLGFWGFIFRGTALAALAALTAIFVKYLFPILPPELPKI
jgi:glutamine synthetase type III